MNIAYLYQKNDPYIEGRIKYLEEKGHRIYKLTYGSSQNYFTQTGIINFNLSDQYPFFALFFKRLVHLSEISRFCKNYHIDILHIGNMLSIFYLMSTGSKLKIIENEGTDVLRTPKEYNLLGWIYRIFYPFTNAVLQDSSIAKNAGLFYGAPLYNNKIIRFGVDFRKFNPNIIKGICRKEINALNNKIIFCSRGHKDLYNLDIIIKSIPMVIEKCPNARFVFACLKKGFQEKYNDLIKQLNVEDKIIIVNQLDHESKMPFYCCDADIVVSIPSSDSSPLSVYEAMACKTPVIISDLPWYHELFVKDRDVVVVPVRNVEKFAGKVIEVINGDKKINLELAYEKVFNYLNYKTENRKLEKFYKGILKNV